MRAFWLASGMLLVGCTNYILPPPADLSMVDLAAEDLSALDDLAGLDMTDLSTPVDLSPPPDMTGAMITGCTMIGQVPDELRCTGLYSNWPARTVASDVTMFAPGFELWSDGAKKTRWIQLPPGGKIDVADLNNWQFPLGTKFWKQFVVPVSGIDTLVETRFMWRINTTGVVTTDWVHTTYVWSADQLSTTRVSNGIKPFPGTASATAVTGSTTAPYSGYEVPTETMCVDCHSGSTGFILGMSAVLMAAPEATGLTYATLQVDGLLTDSSASGNALVPTASLKIPGVAVERQALGRFQANCGVCCHNSHIATAMGQRLRINIDGTTKSTPATVMATDTATTTINVTADAAVYPSAGFFRIRPTDISRSGVYYRDGQRDNNAQMPPICTHASSTAMEAATQAWIEYMTPANGYPAPLP